MNKILTIFLILTSLIIGYLVWDNYNLKEANIFFKNRIDEPLCIEGWEKTGLIYTEEECEKFCETSNVDVGIKARMDKDKKNKLKNGDCYCVIYENKNNIPFMEFTNTYSYEYQKMK